MGNGGQGVKGGYVYIMTNSSMPGLVKIGSTNFQPDERARQLSTTGVPRPFQVVAFQRFENELRAEKELHAMFSQHRVHSRREFFEISVSMSTTG
jgi:T5orf172 domain